MPLVQYKRVKTQYNYVFGYLKRKFLELKHNIKELEACLEKKAPSLVGRTWGKDATHNLRVWFEKNKGAEWKKLKNKRDKKEEDVAEKPPRAYKENEELLSKTHN